MPFHCANKTIPSKISMSGDYLRLEDKVCSINFEPPDNDFLSVCYVYPLSHGAWIISTLLSFAFRNISVIIVNEVPAKREYFRSKDNQLINCSPDGYQVRTENTKSSVTSHGLKFVQVVLCNFVLSIFSRDRITMVLINRCRFFLHDY